MKTCGDCQLDLPIDNFGVTRNRRDGLNKYCRACCRRKTNQNRATLREMAEARANGIIRKPDRIWKPRPKTAPEKVREAIESGAHTRREIKLITRLDWDELMDCLASFWNRQEVAIRKQGDEPHFFWKAA